MRVSLIITGLAVLVLGPYAVSSSQTLFAPVRQVADARPRAVSIAEWPRSKAETAAREAGAVQEPAVHHREDVTPVQRAHSPPLNHRPREIAKGVDGCRAHSEGCLRSVARAGDRKGKAVFAAIAKRWSVGPNGQGRAPSLAVLPARLPGYRESPRKAEMPTVSLLGNDDRGSASSR